MAYWDDKLKRIIRIEPELSTNFPNWAIIDCGCSNGLHWGGEAPRECNRCHGDGALFVHLTTGTVALYPGGSLVGSHLSKMELSALKQFLRRKDKKRIRKPRDISGLPPEYALSQMEL